MQKDLTEMKNSKKVFWGYFLLKHPVYLYGWIPDSSFLSLEHKTNKSVGLINDGRGVRRNFHWRGPRGGGVWGGDFPLPRKIFLFNDGNGAF